MYELAELLSNLQLSEKSKYKEIYVENFPIRSIRPILPLYQNQRHYKKKNMSFFLLIQTNILNKILVNQSSNVKKELYYTNKCDLFQEDKVDSIYKNHSM